MIAGRVRDLLPLVRLELRGSITQITVEFVVDTGFDGEFTLPINLIQRLGARFIGNHKVEFADQFRQRAPHYQVEIEWDEGARLVEVIAVEGRPLMGNGAMVEMDIHIEMTEGGDVLLQPM
jgi:clan AA aspartic protease